MVSGKVFSCYDGKLIYDYANPCKGIDTGDNNTFLRLWHEIQMDSFYKPKEKLVEKEDFSLYKWFPYNKGGSYRKWYGNNEYVLDWSDNGNKLKNFKGSNLRNKSF